MSELAVVGWMEVRDGNENVKVRFKESCVNHPFVDKCSASHRKSGLRRARPRQV